MTFYAELFEEGDLCPAMHVSAGLVYDCGGTLYYVSDGCSCHLGHPPCRACVNAELTCDVCHWTPEDLE